MDVCSRCSTVFMTAQPGTSNPLCSVCKELETPAGQDISVGFSVLIAETGVVPEKRADQTQKLLKRREEVTKLIEQYQAELKEIDKKLGEGETNENEEDQETTSPKITRGNRKEKRQTILQRRAELARERYNKMSIEEKRERNQQNQRKKAIRGLLATGYEMGKNDEKDEEAIEAFIDKIKKSKAAQERLRYAVMNGQSKKQKNQQKNENRKRRRHVESSFDEPDIKEDEEDAGGELQQLIQNIISAKK